MNEFLNIVKEEQIKPEKSFQEIINKLMMKNVRGGEKTSNDINAYDSETLFGGKLYRGNIYIFQYNAKSPSKYVYKGNEIYYNDTLPIILVTSETPTCLRGINLNFCNKALKTLILNIIQNLDHNFYNNGGAEKLANNKNLVISKNVYTFLSSAKAEEEIIKELKKHNDTVDYEFIFRNYAVSNIKNIRLIEPWQWKYLPSLSYDGTEKYETMKAIQRISGIDQVTL